MKLTVQIEGQDATGMGQAFLSETRLEAHMAEQPAAIRTKSIDATAFVEIAGMVKAGAEALTAVVALAAAIWKWRQEIKQNARTIIQKEANDETERLLLDQETTVEEIEEFLKGE